MPHGGSASTRTRGKTAFRDAAAMWLNSRADLKPRTRREYTQMLAPASERRGDMRTLGLDAVFGGYPVNKITRARIVEWIADLSDADKRPSTVRHNYFLLKQVLQYAVDEGWTGTNHATHVRLPSDHGKAGVVDDPAQFLTPEQVFALTDATPWPYDVMVHTAGWTGLRAGELAGCRLVTWNCRRRGADRRCTCAALSCAAEQTRTAR